MTKKEFERRINKYIDPFILEIMISELEDNEKHCDELIASMRAIEIRKFTETVVYMIEIIRDIVFDKTNDVEVNEIISTVDGAMMCWCEVIPPFVFDKEYESEEVRELSTQRFNRRGIQLQMIVDRMKEVIMW